MSGDAASGPGRAALRPLEDYRSATPRPILVPALLIGSATAIAISMPLAWHHREIPGPRAGLAVVHGYEIASWLIVAALLEIIFASRFHWRGFGYYGKWLLTILACLVTLAMFADYVDSGNRAAQLNMAGYYGPGFYVGLAATALLIVSVPAAWRTRD